MKPQQSLERKPRILWATVYCLLDTSSGASVAVREMLRQLARRGYEIGILGATVFDDAKGVTRLQDHWDDIQKKIGQIITGPFNSEVQRADRYRTK